MDVPNDLRLTTARAYMIEDDQHGVTARDPGAQVYYGAMHGVCAVADNRQLEGRRRPGTGRPSVVCRHVVDKTG